MWKHVMVLAFAGASPVFSQTLPSTVCAVQQQRLALEKERPTPSAYKESMVKVRGRIVFSPRGFFMLTEPGCSSIPIADAGKAVEPKVAFNVLKDENYEKLKAAKWRSRQEVVTAELEGRLDNMAEVLKGWKSGDAGLHLDSIQISVRAPQDHLGAGTT